jgi:PadR family transcriptional regulator, regulatory protein PadR
MSAPGSIPVARLIKCICNNHLNISSTHGPRVERRHCVQVWHTSDGFVARRVLSQRAGKAGAARRPYLTFEWNGLDSICMPNKDKARSKADVLQGTLDLMVLQTLATLGSQHGYAIAARLEQVSAGALRLNMGTLYPGLMRLEQRGLVRGEWGVTDTNRKARFYTLTAAGRRELKTERAEWDRMTAIMRTLLQDEA